MILDIQNMAKHFFGNCLNVEPRKLLLVPTVLLTQRALRGRLTQVRFACKFRFHDVCPCDICPETFAQRRLPIRRLPRAPNAIILRLRYFRQLIGFGIIYKKTLHLYLSLQ
jgi:hypothetical protein